MYVLVVCTSIALSGMSKKLSNRDSRHSLKSLALNVWHHHPGINVVMPSSDYGRVCSKCRPSKYFEATSKEIRNVWQPFKVEHSAGEHQAIAVVVNENPVWIIQRIDGYIFPQVQVRAAIR